MHRLAVAAIFVSTSALAQSTPPNVGPDNGFFRPTPGGDPSLTHPPVAPYTTLSSTPPAPAPLVVPVPAEVPVAPIVVNEEALAAERELNRAQQVALEAQARARGSPPLISGAFSGSTSERDR